MTNFLEQAERHLVGKTASELKAMVLKLAASLTGEDLQDFLASLESNKVIVRKNNAVHTDAGKIMSHLKSMLEGVEDYNIEAYYYDHWHDDGYEIQDDDGFCDDFYKGYSGAMGLAGQGMFEAATEAFELLFEVVECFNAHFDYHNGFTIDMFIGEGVLKVDLAQGNAIWGYCQLMAKPKDMYAILESIFKRRSSYGEKQKFIEFLDAGSEAVPDREKILEAWVKILLAQPPQDASPYLKEAAELSRDITIMEAFVETSGADVPLAYIDLCEMYVEGGGVGNEKIIEVAKKGIENTPVDAYKRANLATLLANIAMSEQDEGAYIYAVTQRFYSRMDINNFLPVYSIGDPEITAAAIKQLDAKHSNPKDFADYYRIHFLNRDYTMAFEAIKDIKDSLGWSFGLKGAMFPYFLGLLAGFNDSATMIQTMLKSGLRDSDAPIMYKLLRENIGPVSTKEFEEWHDWCAQEVGKRVDAIVSGQHRKSYYKAAYLLVSFCEVRLHAGDLLPYRMLQTYVAKYPRHSAFRGEIKEALGLAGLKDVRLL